MTALHRLGTWRIGKISDLNLEGLALARLLPGYRGSPTGPSPTSEVTLSVHSWLLLGERHTILVDTGAGNGKARPEQPLLDRLQTNYLENLTAAGVEPADVDTILLTHVHADHVGWNTRLEGTRWISTFPHAEVVCSDLEWRYGAALESCDDACIAACRDEAGIGAAVRTPLAGTFADSMSPLEPTGKLRRIAIDGSEKLSGIKFMPFAGHSIDHAAIMLRSGGRTALFSGDVFHHPIEIEEIDLVSCFCEFPGATRSSRRRFLDLAARTDALVFTSHFPGSSVGRIERRGSGFAWHDEPDAS